MPRQRHHYVPVFYQKGFAASDGMLWKWDRKYGTKPYRRSPRENCFEWDLYAVFPDNAPEDRRIETEILSHIDNDAAPIIARLGPGFRPNPEETRKLVMFIGLQFTRMPSFARAVKTTVETHMNEYLRMRFGTVKRAAEALKQLEDAGDRPTVSAESMVSAVQGGRIKANATETMFLRQMFDQANNLGQWLENSAWTLLVAPRASGFVLSDQPFVTVPPKEQSHESASYGTPGAISYFPLTRRLCLKAWHGDYGFNYLNVDSRLVRTINQNIAANSERFILAADRPQLESVVEKSGSRLMDQGDRFTIEVVRAGIEDSYIKFAMKPRRHFY